MEFGERQRAIPMLLRGSELSEDLWEQILITYTMMMLPNTPNKDSSMN